LTCLIQDNESCTTKNQQSNRTAIARQDFGIFYEAQPSLFHEHKEGLMGQIDLYVINYRLHGEAKSFVIRTKKMDNSEAWQWASCDAGIAPIPKPGRPPLKRFSRPMAERFGVTDVQWRESTALAWDEVHKE
jgi:hypothetical protein